MLSSAKPSGEIAPMTRNLLIAWFVIVLACALGSRWGVYNARADRCSLDGNRLIPIYRVDLMLDGLVKESFCCIRCATEWPDTPLGAYWQVRDETTGQLMDATQGCFVESSVVTIPSRQDRMHVFKGWVDAMNHMAECDGRRVANPLAGRPSSDAADVASDGADAIRSDRQGDKNHD